MTGALIIFGTVLAGLAVLLTQLALALWIVLPAIAALVTARRCHRIPLYWVTALVAASTLPLAVLGGEPLRPRDESVSAQLDQMMAVAASWPVLAGIVGAVVTTLLSWGSSPWAKSLSGLSWGLLAMVVLRQVLGT